MKKVFLLLCLWGVSFSVLNSQTLFDSEQILGENNSFLGKVRDFINTDVDGDSVTDLIVLADKGIFLNEFNQNAFGTFIRIDSILPGPISSTHSFLGGYADDIDGDGDNDLLVTGITPIRWYENVDGQGTFEYRSIDIGFTFKDDTFLRDIDGDNDLDLLFIESLVITGYEISWLEFDQNISDFNIKRLIFQSEQDNTLDVRILYAGDLDGDDDIDFSVIKNDTTHIQWYENINGVGEFNLGSLDFSMNFNFDKVKFIDIDEDNDLDIFRRTASSTPELFWYENTLGDNSVFDVAQLITEGLESLYNSNVAEYSFFDKDEDGDLDVFFNIRSNIYLAENIDGQGTFGEPELIISHIVNPDQVSFFDIDGDNDQDLIVSNTFEISWYENLDGNYNLGPQKIIAYTPQENGKTQLIDFDQDGINDYVFHNDGVVFCKGLGNGKFDVMERIYIEGEIVDNLKYLGDIDNDGDIDIISIENTVIGTDPESFYYVEANKNNSDGTFTVEALTPLSLGLANIFDNMTSIDFSDIDNDGDLDLVTSLVFYSSPSQSYEYELKLYKNDLGIFTESQLLHSDSYFNLIGKNKIRIGDIDNDGDMDIMQTYEIPGNDDYYFWYRNLGGGIFSEGEAMLVNQGGNSRVFSLEDINSDGFLDLITSRKESGGTQELVYLEYDQGINTFTDYQIIMDISSYPSNLLACDAADLDSDGDIDLYLQDGETISMVWLENENGQGDFGAPQFIGDLSYFITTGSVYLSLLSGDFDNDGDLDIGLTSRIESFTTGDDQLMIWYPNLLGVAPISGVCYYDQNQNQVKDNNEVILSNCNVSISPDALANYPASGESFKFYVDNGTYEINAEVNDPIWSFTTDSVYQIVIQDTVINNLNFGLYTDTVINEVTPTLTSAATRCGFEVPFWMTFKNTGTQFNTGQIILSIDSLTSPILFTPAPDSINGNNLIWDYQNLAPTESKQIELLLQMPGVDYIGELLSFNVISYVSVDGVLEESINYTYKSTLNCAYDPNDKLVRPTGVYEENYTLFGEELEYTVRFQNTGTDTAFTVRIEDYLNENLDWTSFRPVAASHDYEVNLNTTTGLVEYLFENILLPDSTTNEPASHGYLIFRIKPFDNLAENTVIENTADIFFDFNPPIQTNTTLNTFVSDIPVSVVEPLRRIELTAFPNPFAEGFILNIEAIPDVSGVRILLWDIHGQIHASYTGSPDSKISINAQKLPAGIYFCEVQTDNRESLGRVKLVKQ